MEDPPKLCPLVLTEHLQQDGLQLAGSLLDVHSWGEEGPDPVVADDSLRSLSSYSAVGELS